MQKLLIPLLLLLSFNVSALLEVNLDGTKPYTEIQTAINSAATGDTILVYPGTYYENLILDNTNSLSLFSLEAITGDTTYISQTIINGSLNQGSVILCHENIINFTVRGFIITGGSGYLMISNTYGGGIFIHSGELNLINSVVKYNHSDKGGGITLGETGSLFLSGTVICNNISYTGGGGLLIIGTLEAQCGLDFDQVNRSSIYDNYAQQGSEIHWVLYRTSTCEVYLDKFTVADPDRFYIDYWDFDNQFFEDLNHTPFAVIDIQEGVHEQIDADLFVANEGDDNNSGLTPEDPFKSVFKAFQLIKSNPENPRTIYMAPGEYNSSVYGLSNIPIALKSFVTLEGVSPEETKIIIDKSVSNWPVGVVNCVSMKFEDITVKNLTLANLSGIAIASSATKNFRVENVIVENCNSEHLPTIYIFAYLKYATAYFKDVIIRGNASQTVHPAAGSLYAKKIVFDNVTVENNINLGNDGDSIVGILDIYVSESLVIKNSKFINNDSVVENPAGSNFRFMHYPGYLEETSITIDNSLFANNTNGATSYNFFIAGNEVFVNNSTFANNSGGHSISVTVAAYLAKIYNTIIANNGQSTPISYGESLIVDNCLFSNTDNIASSPISTDVTFGENNIYGANPLFAGTDPANPTYYMLAGDDINGYSSAIDAGSRDFSFMPDWYEEERFDLYGNPRLFGSRVDIGCYEYQGYTVGNNITEITHLLTSYNYPNPFNPETTIEFNNPVQGEVNVNIYNLKGQLVKKLLEDNLTQGVHKVVWNGTDSNEKQVSSGVYFYKINSANKESITKKIILMK